MYTRVSHFYKNFWFSIYSVLFFSRLYKSPEHKNTKKKFCVSRTALCKTYLGKNHKIKKNRKGQLNNTKCTWNLHKMIYKNTGGHKRSECVFIFSGSFLILRFFLCLVFKFKISFLLVNWAKNLQISKFYKRLK